MSDQVLIIGWNERAESLIHELKESGYKNCQVLVVRDDRDKAPKAIGIDVITVEAGPKGLQNRVNEQALAAIILSDEKAASDAAQGDVDSWVCRQIVALRENESTRHDNSAVPPAHTREAPRRIRILAEIQHEGNVAVARASGADEVVCSRRFGTTLLAQVATQEGIREVFDDLFETRGGTQQIYIDALAPHDLRYYQTFDRALALYPARHKRRIPIGIRRDGATLLNPVGDHAKLRAHDKLIVVATGPHTLTAAGHEAAS